MGDQSQRAFLERLDDQELSDHTLIEGMPGHGLVAAIAVDQITKQLQLDQYGNIYSQSFPPVVTFEKGIVQDLVRVYFSDSPPIMTLESDLALPPKAFEPLSTCMLEELADSINKAIFLAGAPAETEDDLGTVRGIGTTPAMIRELEAVNIPIAQEHGVVGGITGAMVRACYRANVPAMLLIVYAHPHIPDPGAARSVIEKALEPLVDFEIDTTDLKNRAAEIQEQMHRIAKQFEELDRDGHHREPRTMGMYQ